jgi:hypothetical protein
MLKGDQGMRMLPKEGQALVVYCDFANTCFFGNHELQKKRKIELQNTNLATMI